MLRSLALLGSIGSAAAGTILWDGRFNASSEAEIDAWSWSNQGASPYQYYIHGDGNITEYLNFDESYKNPADSGSDLGVKVTLDSTAYWEGQTMRRTELIPQTSAAINSGKVYYHFSMQHTDVNPPSEFREHQICFFESHFTEMKAGWISGESGTSDALLRWNANSATQWNTTFDANVWHNVAYGIDFSANTVEFYHSTGSDDLTLTVPAVSVSASSNGADWHLGVLELPRDGYTDSDEDLYFSGVYIESGDVTLSVAGPGNVAVSSSSAASSAVASSTVASSSVATSSSTAATSSVAISSAANTVAAALSTSASAVSSTLSSAVSSAVSSSKNCTKPASSAAAAYSSSVAASYSNSTATSSSTKTKCSKSASATATTSSKSKCTKPASSLASAHASSVAAAFSTDASVVASTITATSGAIVTVTQSAGVVVVTTVTETAGTVIAVAASPEPTVVVDSVSSINVAAAVVSTSTTSSSSTKCTKPASSAAAAYSSSVAAALSSSASAGPTTLVTVTASATASSIASDISAVIASETAAATATGISDARRKAIDTVVDIVASMEMGMAEAYVAENN